MSKKASRSADRGRRRRPDRAGRRPATSVVPLLVLLLFLGGAFAVFQWQRTPGSSPFASAGGGAAADAASVGEGAEEDGESPWYRDASIGRVADIIRTSDHALIYYRSPT